LRAKEVQWIINPYDEWYALVRAIELKEKRSRYCITPGDGRHRRHRNPLSARHWPSAETKPFALMRIARIPFYIAAQIAEVARQGAYDLIFTGKETIDYNGSAIGGMIAELLDLPYVSLATKFDLNGTTATVIRETEGGEETD